MSVPMFLVKVCRVCQQPFRVYENKASRQEECPTCLAERHVQHGDAVNSIPRRRQVQGLWTCLVDSLPGEWVEMPPKRSHDTPYYKIEVRGSRYGASWQGQITLFAIRPIEIGEAVRVRAMVAEHRVKVVEFSRATSGLSETAPPSVAHRAILPVYTREEDIPVLIEEGQLLSQAADAQLRDELMQRNYIVLHPKGWDRDLGAAPYRLVWAEARTKTTEKGLGAQYHASIEASAAVYTESVRGGLRGGRAHTEGMLAIVPAGQSIIVRSSGYSGSGERDTRYNWEKHYPA